MNTHDKIELPPEFRSGNGVPVTVATIKRERMVEILGDAIEADRKRRTPPSEPFAIVIDRIYDGEGPSLAYWNGENYQFSDGDCFNREGETLDGYTAEFLTDHQLEERLFSDRKRQGEVVVTKTPEGEIIAVTRQDAEGKILSVIAEADRKRRGEPVGYVMPTDMQKLRAGSHALIGPKSQGADIPLYLDPQPAEPVAPFQGKVERHSDQSVLVRFPSCRLASEFERNVAAYAEPVKVPSEDGGET